MYEYTVEDLSGERSVTFEMSQPLSCVAVGNVLDLVNDHLEPKLGSNFVIRHISTLVTVLQPPTVTKVRIHIWVEQEPRLKFLPSR